MTTSYEAWKRHRECDRKATYYCDRCANHALLRMWADGKTARTYVCEYCDLIHLTSKES